jgi:AcrR family transcriptional regulator
MTAREASEAPAAVRRKPRGSDTHARLIRVAIEMFHESGYEQTSLQNIADQMGFSKAAIYYHVKSKEALLMDVYASVLQPVIIEARSISKEPAEDNLHVFLALIRHRLRVFTSDFELNAIFQIQRSLLSPESRAFMRALDREYYAIFKDAYGAGVKDKSIRPGSVSMRVNAVLGMCNIMFRWYHPTGKIRPNKAIEEIIAVISGGISNG